MAYSSGAVAAAAIAQARQALGALIEMDPDSFLAIVSRCEKPLVVVASGDLLQKSFRYLVGYKGLAFHTKSKTERMLPGKIEIAAAKSISMPF